MKDGERDFSKYSGEQIERSLPLLPMDAASVEARQNAELVDAVASGRAWISAPGLLTFWLPCLRRAVVRADKLEVRGPFGRGEVPLADIELVRWYDAQPMGEWHLAVIELRRDSRFGRRIRLLPRSRKIMRAFATHVGAVQGGLDVADPDYVSTFVISGSD